METWISAGRNLRYKEHPTRRHGPNLDRYWCLKYKLDGKDVSEAVGWWSRGVTKPMCLEILAELRRNWRSGQGPQTYKEIGQAARSRTKAEAAAVEKQSKAAITLREFWEKQVRPEIELRYSQADVGLCSTRMRTWLAPLGDKPLSEITTDDLESLVVRPMIEANLSPGTIEAVIRLFSMIWHRAKKPGVIAGESPTATVKRPKLDNRRVRFLSPGEARELLAALEKRSIGAHDLALLSLFTGLRAGECTALTWADVDFERGTIFVKDSKKSINRHAYITAEVRKMLTRRKLSASDSPFVFPGERGGEQSCAANRPYQQVVKAIGFNDGVGDPRQRVVFHTLRHTYASWLVQRGHPLYTVSQLMGHRNIAMTERYAHLAPDTHRAAALKLQGFLK